MENNRELLASKLNLSVEDFNSALDSSELLDVAKVYNNDELNSLSENLSKENNKGYTDGKTAGTEMTIKSIKRIADIDIEGKDLDTVLDAYANKIRSEKAASKDERYNELKNTFDQVSKTLEAKNNDLKSWENKYKTLQTNNVITNNIGELSNMSNEDALIIINNTASFGTDEEGREFVEYNGNVIRDELGAPKKWGEGVNHIVNDKGWKPKPQGRGEGSTEGQAPTTKITKQSQYIKMLESKGLHENSPEAQDIYDKFVDRANFVYDV